MPPDDAPLHDYAASVADGSRVDWPAAESTVDTLDGQNVLRQLQVIANLAAVHRHAESDGAMDSSTVPIVPAARDLSSVPDDSSSPDVDTWGPLLLRRKIGEGRFGTVYLAWDPALEREVALKLLRDPSRTAAVIDEGRLLARVRHPNVVLVHGVDQFEDAVGLWMEFVDGLTIKDLLATRGVMSSREAALLGIDLCRALAAVHQAGLLHRDIKAQNVMRDKTNGRIVLMDFGAGEIRADRVAGPRRRTGTPLYLAPEVFIHGEPATIASDIYSLGVLLYHAVTAEYPVGGATIDEVRDAHRTGMTPLTDRLPDLPSRFARVVERALDPDPSKRQRSAGTLQQDLIAALELDVAQSRPVSNAEPLRSGPSVAVLRFDNISPDRSLDYFCSGLAEELLTGLATVAGLRVAARTSSLAAQHAENPDIRSVCRQLEVDAVLKGAVRKEGDRLRITAQLVSAEDGYLWADKYDRRMADVFAVQEDIACSVIDCLKVKLSDLARRPLIKRHTNSSEAYDCYLRGRHNWGKRYQGGLKSAIDDFNEALTKDPDYALAHAGLADAFAFLGFYSIQQPKAAFNEAHRAAERALTIEPDLPEAHTSLALVKLGRDWDLRGAELEFTRALELDPSQVFARIYLSWLLVLLGDSGAAAVQARRAQETEPRSPLVNSGAAHTYFLAARYEEAVAYCQKGLDVDDKCIIAIYVMGACRAKQSRLPEAIELMERAVAMSGRSPFFLAMLGNFYARSGADDKARQILEELDRMAPPRYVPPHSQAFIYAGLNELDRAFEWQAKAYADGASPFNYFSPVIDNMHGDPRHGAEMRRMGLRT